MAPGGDGGEVEDSEEDQVQREWHLWIAVLLILGGVGVVVAPEGSVPGLIRGLGPFLIVVGIVGWLLKEGYQRWG